MKYKMLIDAKEVTLSYHNPNYKEMLANAIDCERLDYTDARAFRVVIDNKEYKLQNQYVFLKENITLYVLNWNLSNKREDC